MVDSSSAPKTVLLRGSPQSNEATAKAGGNIIPGHLIETFTDGTVRPHSTGGGNAIKEFAREAEITGHGVDDVYADGSVVYSYSCKPGDRIYAWLKNGQNVAIGTFLESAGNGSLRDVATAGYIVAKALEAVNASGVDTRIRVEVI